MHCPDSAARRRCCRHSENCILASVHRPSAALATDFGYFTARSHFENKIHQSRNSATFGQPASTPNGIPVSHAGPWKLPWNK
jgi:hypothetical protein